MRLQILETESKHYVCEKCNKLTNTILKITQDYSTKNFYTFLCIDCLKKGVNLTLEIEKK